MNILLIFFVLCVFQYGITDCTLSREAVQVEFVQLVGDALKLLVRKERQIRAVEKKAAFLSKALKKETQEKLQLAAENAELKRVRNGKMFSSFPFSCFFLLLLIF